MNDKQDNQSLLVEQEEALGVYFDSLLLSDEIEYLDDMQEAEPAIPAKIPESQLIEKQSAQPEPETQTQTQTQRLQSARDFLRASKLRQQTKNTPKATPSKREPLIAAVTESAVQTSEQEKKADPYPQAAKTITPGPVSPKPREYITTVQKNSQPLSKSETKSEGKPDSVIVFSEKDKHGKVKEEVIIPRSQRLAQNKSLSGNTAKAASKTITRTKPLKQQSSKANRQPDSQQHNHSVTVNLENASSENITNSEKSKVQEVVQKHRVNSLKEAPELDLSLFLPKIKTLSDEEIKQQLEALTQAVVSQAQVETELQELSQYEKYKQQTQQGDSEALIQNINNAPDWAIPEFQVLLFAVSGLKLAIPLSELNGILEWGDEYINELPGHASWYLGLINHLNQNVPVIDTLQQVVPKERWPAGHLDKPQFKHIILIDDCKWGLACEQVLEIITLKTESVKWRSSRTKRRWLLGTVIDQKCALLDSSEFASMLETGKDSLIANH